MRLLVSLLLCSAPLVAAQNGAAAAAPDVNKNAAQNAANNVNVDTGDRIINYEDCQEDIRKHCNNKPGVNVKNDLEVLECLQDAGQTEAATLTSACEALVWKFKIKLTQDERFVDAAKKYCSDEMGKNAALQSCASLTAPGYALSCMLDFVPNITQTTQCFAFLSRTERLAFSDFRLIGPFVTKCNPILEKFGCHALTPHKAHENVKVPHTQGMALECILDKVVKQAKTQEDALTILGEDCKHEVLRLAELQSDDWHLDRPLFFACREDREKFCKDVPSGQGKVFECLLLRRNDQFMEPNCSKVLSERAYLMGRDYRMAHPLSKACEKEMKEYKCEPQNQLESAAHFHLSWILLCLETVSHQAQTEKKGEIQPPSQQCQHEMLTHRQMMLQHFQMSPEIVMTCAQEIDKWCSPRGDIEIEGKTLHCLMEHAQARYEKVFKRYFPISLISFRKDEDKLGAQCMASVTNVVKVADIGSNYKVDTVLYASCKPLIDGPCQQDAQSETATLTCLMRHVDNQDMTAECEKRLLEVQYFMARDWTLDPQLYAACHQEAVSRCSALDNWHMQKNDQNRVDPGPQVLACLYRSAYDEKTPLSPQCGHEVRRVLHSRAARVNLIPDVEDNCREALSEYCSHNVKPMEEMNCLQENFEKPEFKKKHPNCHNEVKKFTEMEAKDTKLNRVLVKACRPVIQNYCNQHINEEIDHGDVMECLSMHKDAPEMNSKCHSYVNHFELVSIRDYHFSYKFKEACEPDIVKYCPGHGDEKSEIIRCLSEVRFEHKVLGHQDDLSAPCKKQLRVAYLQQEQVEVSRRCSFNHFKESLQMTRCPDCKSMVFYREKIEAADNTMDDELQRKCKYDIKKFCGNANPENVLPCLSNTKFVRLLQKDCKEVVKERMQEAARDVRLRPGLLNACKADAEKYCHEDMQKIDAKQYGQQILEGVVVNCLREKYRQSFVEATRIHLSDDCVNEVTNAIVEAELDPRLDPALYNACKNVINLHCSASVIASGGHFDNVIECLKAEFNKGAISSKDCGKEIARRTQESLVDIHLDPVLHEACALDITRFCNDIPPGNSRVVMCLVDVASGSKSGQMSQNCKGRLEDRNKLWMKAHEEYKLVLPENFQELVSVIANHPNKVSFLGWISAIIFILFLIGCCCGRVTKRTHMELKNR
ncbi:hypothetical protein WR25_13801 [Diploscapter pachys]|uniref:Golgi apparatus protein 1 n=1 Tax=Diploscapter pachys TaxID=2018661 RepID=A0A2A2J1Y4_9BILA|nr:hypothetical protein WR25_13801 [Diploscapter pachys]